MADNEVEDGRGRAARAESEKGRAVSDSGAQAGRDTPGGKVLTVIGLIVGFALFAGCLYFMGNAFDPAHSHERAIFDWSAAMVCMGLSFAVPIYVIASIDGQRIKVEYPNNQ